MNNSDVVHTFIAACEALSVEGMLETMTLDVRYVNVGFSDVTGHDAVRESMGPFLGRSKSSTWTLHHIAETPSGAVLTERTDVFELEDRILTVPVMGIFEFRDGKISAWRDYFDLPGFMKQMA
jgi:limonene-1,2-epoxide hydrolase